MSAADLQEALSPLLNELQDINSGLQLSNQINAGVLFFLGMIFGAILIHLLLRRF